MPRILVVDDEPLISMMVADWLSELGCETLGPAHTVSSALNLINSAVLDGAILDVSIGNERCYPLAEALRDRGVPFAFATGRDAGDLPSHFIGTLVLLKPFDFEALKSTIDKLLANMRT